METNPPASRHDYAMPRVSTARLPEDVLAAAEALKSPLRVAIIHAVVRRPGLTVTELAKEVGASRTTVWTAVVELERAQVLLPSHPAGDERHRQRVRYDADMVVCRKYLSTLTAYLTGEDPR